MSRHTRVLCVFLVVMMLPALGLSPYTAAAKGARSQARASVTLTWWSHNNPAFVAANKMMIARFTKANPGIHINYQNFPYNVFVRKLQASYRAHNASDMQQMFGTWVTQ